MSDFQFVTEAWRILESIPNFARLDFPPRPWAMCDYFELSPEELASAAMDGFKHKATKFLFNS